MDRKEKAVVFDFDGVLVKGASSWLEVHKHFGIEENDADMELFVNKKITYNEFMRKDIAKWPAGIHINEIATALSSYTIIKNAKETIEELKQKEFEIGIISCGLDILVNKVARELDINLDFVMAEGLETDKDGYLTGIGIARVELFEKGKALIKLSDKMEINTTSIIAVEDSKYGISMLQAAGFGIAFNPKDEKIRKVAHITIESNDLSDLSEILDYI